MSNIKKQFSSLYTEAMNKSRNRGFITIGILFLIIFPIFRYFESDSVSVTYIKSQVIKTSIPVGKYIFVEIDKKEYRFIIDNLDPTPKIGDMVPIIVETHDDKSIDYSFDQYKWDYKSIF